jgi:hypothetical protein
MQQKNYASCTPRRRDPAMATEPVLNLASGYVRRALSTLPQQGARAPWRLYQNYIKDLVTLRFGRLDDPEMEFRPAPAQRPGRAAEPRAADSIPQDLATRSNLAEV